MRSREVPRRGEPDHGKIPAELTPSTYARFKARFLRNIVLLGAAAYPFSDQGDTRRCLTLGSCEIGDMRSGTKPT